MRDEDLVLSNKEMIGELRTELKYEEFNEINEQLIKMVKQALAGYIIKISIYLILVYFCVII